MGIPAVNHVSEVVVAGVQAVAKILVGQPMCRRVFLTDHPVTPEEAGVGSS